MDLEVWAPRVERLDVVFAGGTTAMTSAGNGWWRADVDLGPDGDRYALRIDDGDELPDPRSRRQPDGVHGASMTVDPSTFDPVPPGWQPRPLDEAVIYELHIGTFTESGTFDGATERLSHLVDLGVTHVEVMPVAAFPGRYGWGYDGVHPYAVHEPYGGPHAFARFVRACHDVGLAVLLDVVHNHLGPDGNVLSRFGPYFTDRHSTPWGEAVNLDGPGSHHVRRYLIDNARWWLESLGVDGLRLDAIHELVDLSARHYLEELATEVAALSERLGRPLVLIGEVDTNDARLVRPPSEGGVGLNGIWADDLHHAIHVSVTGQRDGYYADFRGPADVVRALQRGVVYDGRYSPARDRIVGRPFDTTPRHRLITCIQNHDQVGNRAVGDRLHQQVDPAAARAAATIALLAASTPLLWMGEEWASKSPFPYFCDHVDPDLADAVRTGRRQEFAAFGWAPGEIPDPQAEATARSAILDWGAQSVGEHAETLRWYQTLLELRRRHPATTVQARLVDPDASLVELCRGDLVAFVHLDAGTVGTVDIDGDGPALAQAVTNETEKGWKFGPWGVLVIER